ncbi:MAG TPA: superoxide dismutase family protein [Rhabdaerophilum sp.]|nr:superoxide dismutase family protein [Rhabdaerophilum sp.]
MRVLTSVAALVLASGLAFAQATATHEADVINNKGEAIGKASFKGNGSTTVIRIQLKAGALTPGWHGIHLHAVGDCSDHDKFMASKGHVNHHQKKHGLLNAEGPDGGDIPNVFAAADGSVSAEVALATALAGDKGLKDADGSALVIHANEDDHVSQPIGGAGARVACALVK